MITGSIWEKGGVRRLSVCPAILLGRHGVDAGARLAHRLSGGALFGGLLSDGQLMALAAAAYVSYVINAGQFLWKFRLARIEASSAATRSGLRHDHHILTLTAQPVRTPPQNQRARSPASHAASTKCSAV
jgi:hypothetical protein